MHSRLPYLSPLLLTPFGAHASPSALFFPSFDTPTSLDVRFAVDAGFHSPSNATLSAVDSGFPTPRIHTPADANATGPELVTLIRQGPSEFASPEEPQGLGRRTTTAEAMMSSQCLNTGAHYFSPAALSPTQSPAQSTSAASTAPPSSPPHSLVPPAQPQPPTKDLLLVVHRPDPPPYFHLPSPLQNHILSPLPPFHAPSSAPTAPYAHGDPRHARKDTTFQVRSPSSPRSSLRTQQQSGPKKPSKPINAVVTNAAGSLPPASAAQGSVRARDLTATLAPDDGLGATCAHTSSLELEALFVSSSAAVAGSHDTTAAAREGPLVKAYAASKAPERCGILKPNTQNHASPFAGVPSLVAVSWQAHGNASYVGPRTEEEARLHAGDFDASVASTRGALVGGEGIGAKGFGSVGTFIGPARKG